MNTMERMRKTNTIIKKELKKQGWYDIVLFPHTRYFKDLYGLWDGICKKDVKFGCFKLYFLQFKTGYCSLEDKKLMKDFCVDSGMRGLLCELIPKKVPRKSGKGSKTVKTVRITVF